MVQTDHLTLVGTRNSDRKMGARLFTVRFFLKVRCGSVQFNDFASNQTAPHRTAGLSKKKKRTAPRSRVWWQSVEQAFLTVRIELIRRKKTPRTVSSNHVGRAKCHD